MFRSMLWYAMSFSNSVLGFQGICFRTAGARSCSKGNRETHGLVPKSAKNRQGISDKRPR